MHHDQCGCDGEQRDSQVRSSLAQIRDLHALVTSPPGCSSLAGVVGSAALQHSFLSALLPLLDSADMEGLVANLHEEMTVRSARRVSACSRWGELGSDRIQLICRCGWGLCIRVTGKFSR